METSSEEMSPQSFDVAVVGAGPAGCEAALAAAAAGATVLCLTINLDMVGYPPATPVIAEDSDDKRYALLDELKALGGKFPSLLEKHDVASIDDSFGRLLVDRRLLGLAWKELLEHTDGLTLRQALVTRLEPHGRDWDISTSLAEEFTASSVVVAAGTFLNGSIVGGGVTTPGGRWAEIPSNSLAKNLQQLGVELTEIWARTSPRLSSSGIERTAVTEDRLFRDGMQLDEIYAYGLETEGDRISQLDAINKNEGLEHAWITRASYTVLHEVLRAEQVSETLESDRLPGLFFAGRAAGSCNYTEAAILGLIAGREAALRASLPPIRTSLPLARGKTASPHCPEKALLDSLVDRIAHKQIRPITVRIDTESGC